MMPITSIHYTHLLQSIPHSHIPYTHFSLTSLIQSIGSTPTFSYADHIIPFTPIKPIFITPLPLIQLIHTHASLITFLMPLITPYSVTHPIAIIPMHIPISIPMHITNSYIYIAIPLIPVISLHSTTIPPITFTAHHSSLTL